MSARLDFEARLRALRAPKGPAGAPDVPAAVGPTSVSASAIDYGGSSFRIGPGAGLRAADALAWPSVPVAPTAAATTRRASLSGRQASVVALDEHGWPAAPNMTVQRAPDGWPQVPGAAKSGPSGPVRVLDERRASSAPLMDARPADPQERTAPSWLPPSQQQQQQQQQQQYQEQHPTPWPQYEPVREHLRTQTSQQSTPAPVHEQRRPPASPAREDQAPALLLGPEYDEAVRVAQRAIESERVRHVHTAIDDYILAGQLLIGIGRQQHQAPHLQDVLKKKALALLQRAEGLAAWTQQVQALDASQQALDAAFEASQASQDRALSEQEALVSQMQSDNAEMKQRLNQLVVLTKMRTRLRRVVRSRRARKQAEAAAAAASGDPAALASPSLGPDLNDVEGMSDEDDDDRVVDQWYDRSGSTLVDDEDDDDDDEYARMPLPSSVASFRHTEPAVAAAPSSKEEQKVLLVNELHAAIGLPEIDHLRKFEPLSADPTGDAKQQKLQQELERARREAEELRASVQNMERCLRLAAQHSKQRSIKLEQEKQEDLARVRQELELVREQLERERRMSSVSSIGSRRSSVHSDSGDRGDFEDADSMRGLRSSLFKVFSRKKSRESLSGSGDSHAVDGGRGRSVAQRTSEAQSSPRHRAVSNTSKPHQMRRQVPHRFDSDEEPGEEEDDGGVWL